MKTINTYIIEKLKVSKIETNYKPKNKEELVDLMIREIEANGPDCSLNHIDVSNITDMSYLFRGGIGTQNVVGHPILSKFNGDISNWDVSNVINMSGMFSGSKFNQDISNWDVSSVESMYAMFNNSNFNGDISNWDVSNVKSTALMFNNSKFNGNLSNWNISSVINMENMFANSPLKNNPPKWYK